MKYLKIKKWIHLIIFFSLFGGINYIEEGFISEYKGYFLILILLVLLYSRLVSIPVYLSNYRLKEYVTDVFDSLLIFTTLGFISTIFIPSIATSVLFETSLLIIIGYGDYFVAKYYYKREYNFDRLNMYTIIAIVYIIGEIGIYRIGDFTSIRNSIAFVLFMDIFISLIIRRFLVNRNKNQKISNKLTENNLFQPLSPKNDIEKSTYFDMLDFGIKNEDTKNIAITSIYGGGKSSIINSYLSKYDHPREIMISLANFEKDAYLSGNNLDLENQSADDNESNDLSVVTKQKIKEDALQLKIIKHLFYKVSPFKLPKSKYVKQEISPTIIGGTFLVFYLLYTVFIIISNYFLEDVIFINDGYFFLHLIPLILGTIFLILRNYGISLKHVETPVVKFDVGKDETIGTFDKYIDELVYFFSKTDYRIVIIEDVDRYNSIHIFNSLRELNILLNDCETINEKITFLYAINEYLLEEENIRNNKTKFFDLIIPIIPVTSKHNSGGIINEMFDGISLDLKDLEGKIHTSLDIKPSHDFILGLSFYVYDMRTIKNIVNEYIATLKEFSSRQGVDINNINNKKYLDGLFAVIVYKNYMPRDYSDLYSGKGILYTLIEKKEIFYDHNIDDINNLIRQNEKKLEYLDNFSFGKIPFNEIVYEMFMKRYSTNRIYVYDNVGNYQQTISVSPKTDLIKELSGMSFKLSSAGNLLNFEEEFDNLMNSKNEWYSMTAKDRNEISTELYSLRKKKSTVQYQSIGELISNLSSEEIRKLFDNKLNVFNKDKKDNLATNKEIANSIIPEILIYLLKSKKIGEDYASYMNFFIEGKITRNDRVFVQKLYSKEVVGYDLKLTGFMYILPLINKENLSNPNVLNFSLFDYLLLRNELELIQSIFDAFSRTKLLDFFAEYINNSERIDELINYLIKYQGEFLDFAFSKFTMDEYQIDILINYILSYNKASNIVNILNNNSKNIINSFERYLLYHTSLNDEQIITNYNNNLKLLRVKIKNLLDSTDNNKLLKYIEDNSLYQINFNMLSMILNHSSESNIKPSYSNITERGGEMVKYITDNINGFIENVLFSAEKISEEETKIIDLLNNPNVRLENKIMIIQNHKITFMIKSIKSISSSDLYTHMLSNNRINSSVENYQILLKHVITKNESILYYKYLDFVLNSTKDDNFIDFNFDDYIEALFRHKILNHDKIKEFLSKIEYDFNIILNLDIESIIEIIQHEIVDFGLFAEHIQMHDVLNYAYHASLENADINIQTFRSYIEKFEYEKHMEEFIKNLKNEKHREKLIVNFYGILDENYLFNLLPGDFKEEVSLNHHPIINKNIDYYYLIDIGLKLDWFSITEKDNNLIKINPKPSKISKVYK